jgi:hypothetical protein
LAIELTYPSGGGGNHIYLAHDDYYLPRRLLGGGSIGETASTWVQLTFCTRLEPSGFTYDPNDFMKRKIFYFNFVWMKDFGETSMNNLLDMVKVRPP